MRPATPLTDVTEREWQQQVVRLARTLGWTVWHCHDARRTVPGLPDLILIRDRVVFVELKTERGRLSDAQAEWQRRLEAAGAETHVWRPSDLDAAGRVLARRERRAA